MPSATPPPELVETDAERRARPEEEQLLMEAERSFEAEGGIPFEEVRAWVASLSTGNPLPMPTPRKDEAWRRMTDTLAAEKAKARGTRPLGPFASPEVLRETSTGVRAWFSQPGAGATAARRL